MDSNKLQNVILFTSDKKIRSLAIKSLILLEERHKYIKRLEGVLIKMGVGDYENSSIDYLKDRKVILDHLNESLRELTELDNLTKD